MFFRKNQRSIDKEILSNNNSKKETNQIINVKCTSREQLFSAYSYSEDKLNPEFCDYLSDQVKKNPTSENITINIHSQENLNGKEIQNIIKKHYSEEYIEARKQVIRFSIISLVMILLGILTLAVYVLLNHFWDNFYISTIVEIAAWVFVWEAVDYFFLERPLVKAKCLLIQKLYMAKVEIGEDLN